MATADPRIAAVLLIEAVALCSSFLHAQRDQNVTQIPAPVVVRMDRNPHGIAYTVDSKRTGSTSSTDILHALGQVNQNRGSNVPLVVLVDPRLSITDVWNFEGVADKAQLKNIRYFVFNRESGVMAELKWGPTVPLSTNPN